ncbi:MAG TPA: sigma 54-interacting transcriptional regulator, partial [Nitrospirota bacterium]
MLLTKDGSLKTEVSALLPKGYKLVAGEEKKARPADLACIVFDIDTLEVHQIKEYGEKSFVLAVTDQEQTGPVMEAATWGAYEIMHRPLRKERIARILEELHELRREMAGVVPISKDVLAPAATCVIIGRSSLVMGLCEKVARIAQVEVPVLITGETGTGK